MEPTDAGIINVHHDCVDGWHTFTSAHLPGLYVVGRQDDLEELYAEVPTVIEALVHADWGYRVQVVSVETFEEYVNALPASFRPNVRHYSVQKLAA